MPIIAYGVGEEFILLSKRSSAENRPQARSLFFSIDEPEPALLSAIRHRVTLAIYVNADRVSLFFQEALRLD